MPEEQQVVVVEDGLGPLPVDIGGEKAPQIFHPVLAPWEVSFYRFLHGLAGVDAPAVDVHAGALEREAAVVLRQTEFGA